MSDLDIKKIISQSQNDGPRSTADIQVMLTNRDAVSQNRLDKRNFDFRSNLYLTEKSIPPRKITNKKD